MDQSVWCLHAAITHQKYYAQFGCSTQISLDIFNTLHIFTNEPVRQQEMK